MKARIALPSLTLQTHQHNTLTHVSTKFFSQTHFNTNQAQTKNHALNLLHVGLYCTKNLSQWIFDCGATDIMTYDPYDLLFTDPKNRTHIQTAHGE